VPHQGSNLGPGNSQWDGGSVQLDRGGVLTLWVDRPQAGDIYDGLDTGPINRSLACGDIRTVPLQEVAASRTYRRWSAAELGEHIGWRRVSSEVRHPLAGANPRPHPVWCGSHVDQGTCRRQDGHSTLVLIEERSGEYRDV
jgi:hypothetical protein